MATRNLFTQAKGAFFNSTYGWRTTHFWGPVANWGIALAGVYDMTQKDASHISAPMTGTLALYSLAFMRFAWRVSPRNYILLACHVFNEGVQVTQLWRRHQYDKSTTPSAPIEAATPHLPLIPLSDTQGHLHPPASAPSVSAYETHPVKTAFCASVVATGLFVPKLQQRILASKFIPAKGKELLAHPAGPFTIFFWAPMMKWGLSVANLIDYKRPVDKLSVPQQVALAITGVLWTRWSFVITPVNYNLAAVNACLALTGMYHLSRKLIYDPFAPAAVDAASDLTKGTESRTNA